MPVAETADEKSSQAKFSMKMPDWFFDLNEDERKEVIERVSKRSENFRQLTDDELKGLMVSSVKKRSWFKR